MFSIIIRTLLLFIWLSGHQAGGQKTGNVTLSITHFAGSEKLVPGAFYNNSFGETYTISRFKYYISGIKLISTDGRMTIETGDPCYLVYDDNEASKTISLEIPEGSYSAISLQLGVDSVYNVSGAQTGALDPVNGMFWTWNTGYVIVKLEGKSPVSTLPGKRIEYHLGGFKGPDKVNRRITLPFPGAGVAVIQAKSVAINMKVDINAFFSGINELPIKTYSACTVAGGLARQYADNYATMFSITRVDE